MMFKGETHITIIGGGIAGLAAAIACARSGKAVTIYERAATFEEVGAGLQLGPNAVRALQTLDVWDAVEPITYAPPAILIRNASSGRVAKEILLGESFTKRFGQPYRVAHRADLHGALLQGARTLPQVEIILGKEIEAKNLSGPVIAADGIHSQTRLCLFPEAHAQLTSNLIFRALVPMPQNANLRLDCVNLWMFPNGHVVTYPVGRDHKLNVVAVTQGKKPHDHFFKACSELEKLLTQIPAWLEWPTAFVPPLPVWHKDLVMLIGDAAHGTLPFLAQGAAMALEDAAALLTCENAPSFEQARRSRCDRLHQQTLATGRIYHLAWPLSQARDFTLRFTPGQLPLDRMDWLYSG